MVHGPWQNPFVTSNLRSTFFLLTYLVDRVNSLTTQKKFCYSNPLYYLLPTDFEITSIFSSKRDYFTIDSPGEKLLFSLGRCILLPFSYKVRIDRIQVSGILYLVEPEKHFVLLPVIRLRLTHRSPFSVSVLP